MKMAAAAGNCDEQVRIEGSTAHDPADGIDSFSLRVTNFSSQSSAHAVEHRTSKLRRGATMDGVQRLTVMINRKDYYGRNCNPHFWFRRGYSVEVRACANGFLQVFSPPGALPAPKREWRFPAGRYVRRRGSGGSPPGALSAPKGEWPYTEATPSGAAPTSPPEGVFRHKRRMELVELSGRITGRLGYTRRPEPTP